MDHTGDGVMIADSKDMILYVNQVYTRQVHAESKDLIGSNLRDYITAGDTEESPSLRALAENRHIVSRVIFKNDPHMLVSSSPICLPGENTPPYVISFSRGQEDLDAIQDEIYHIQDYEMQKETEAQLSKERYGNIITTSPAMKRALSIADYVKDISTTVLIRGESGTGKDVIARHIHSSGKYASNPFLAIDCGAIPENLLESELFGYTAGSFTGASRSGKTGLLEAAGDGILFLDEIGDLPIPMQSKLLRVLENRTFYKIGDTKEHKFTARIIAATNRNLEDMIQDCSFRKDLFYRLNIISIQLPSLRNRREDIIPLTSHFLDDFNEKYGFKKRIHPDLMRALYSMDWAGNIRELRNTVESLVLMDPHPVLTLDSLELIQSINTPEDLETPSVIVNGIQPLGKAVEETEKQLLLMAQKRYGSYNKMSRALEVDNSTISRKMRHYKLNEP